MTITTFNDKNRAIKSTGEAKNISYQGEPYRFGVKS